MTVDSIDLSSASSRRSTVARLAALGLLACVSLVLLAACTSEDEAPESAGVALAERWLRLGESHTSNVLVYDRALPPVLSALLNPNAGPDTPAENLNAIPVHPAAELMGSYLLRRSEGTHLVWLFFELDVDDQGALIREVREQLDDTPWQVLSERGTPSYAVVEFVNTRGEDVTGTAVIESLPNTSTFTLVVERGGEQRTLTVSRGAATPVIEAELRNDLTVSRVYAGLTSAAGLEASDRIVRVGETDVATQEELRAALVALGTTGERLGLTYLLQIGPASGWTPPPYAVRSGLTLPETFPLRPALESMLVDEYQTFIDPSGNFWAASLLTRDSANITSARIRDELQMGDWEIVTDEPVGFATFIQFTDATRDLLGSIQVDLFPADESFTQVVIQIESGFAAGN